MTLLRKSLLAAALLLVTLVAGVYWVIGTDGGTRWLLDRGEAYMPAELRLGSARGSLLRGVEIESLEWRDGPTSLETGRLHVDIRLLPLLGRHLVIDELDIDRVELRLGDGGEGREEDALPTIDLPIDVTLVSLSLRELSIAASDFERVIDEIAASASLQDSDLRIAELEVNSDWLDLDVNGRITLADDYPGSIDASWRWKESEAGPFAGRLSIAGDVRQFTLDHSLATPLIIASSGTVSYESGSVDVDLLNNWDSLEWPIEQRTLYSSKGTLRVTGNPVAYSLELDANARVDDQPDTSLRVAADGDRQTLRISSLDARNSLGRISAKGAVSWLPDRTVDLRVENIDGEISGHRVEGEGHLRFLGPDIALSGTRLQVGSNTVQVDGTFGKTLSLDADFDVVDIAEIFPDGAGSIRGAVSLSGPVDRPDVQMDLTGAALEWREYSLGSFSADGNLSAIENGSAELFLEDLTVGELALDQARLTVVGQMGAHELGVTLRTLYGDVTLEATGGYDRQSWSGQLASLTIDNDVLGRWTTRDPSRLTASSERVSLSNTCLFGPQDRNEVCVSGARVAEGPAEFDVTVSGVSVSVIPASLPEGVSLAGYVYANLAGKWENGRLTAKSEIELRDGEIEAAYDEDYVSIAVSRAVSETAVTDNRVESTLYVDLDNGRATGAVRLTIDDLSNRQSAISGRVDVSSSDVSSIAAIVPGIRRPQGKVDSNLAIAGTLSSPEFLGEVSLADASFSVRQSGIDVSDFNLRLTQLAPGQLRLVGQARSGDGQISVEGRTEIGSDSGIRSEIQLSGENFELARLPDWQVAASPSIAVVFDERATTITGELVIPTANIRVRDIPVSAESSSPDAVVHRQESVQTSRARRIDIDVRTALGDDVEFSGFGLTTGLDGAVQVRGGSHAVFTGQGRLSFSEGRYKAYGQELEIDRGELIFNGPLENPRLNIRAIRRIRDVVAGIEVSGMPTQLQSSVFSDPAMSDAEALSYLLTGRPLASATSAGDGNTLNNAAFALGISGAGNVASQVRNQLGLETLTIEGGVEDSQLIAGKRFGDRLLVEYGYGLVDELGTLLLRYQLSDRIVLESRTGSVSNLDVVYSVKKK